MRDAFILTGATGGILIARYDWRLLAVWVVGVLSPEAVALGAPLVLDQVERARLWAFLEREYQRGGKVRVEHRRKSSARYNLVRRRKKRVA